MDIKNYLRDMDREEEEIRATIMRLQVRIQQLHDTRLVLMGREEERTQRAGLLSTFGSLGGGSIVVRDPLRMAAPEPQPAAALEAPKKQGGQPGRRQAKITPRILALLAKAEHPLSVGEIGEALPEVQPHKRLHGACHSLKLRGMIVWDTFHRYSITPLGRKELKGETVPYKPRVPRASHDSSQQAVLEALRVATAPLASGDIIAAINGGQKPSKRDRDRVYNAISRLRREGDIVTNDWGLHSLPVVKEEDAA